MTEQAYMIAWAGYACGYLLVLLILWRWTRHWWRIPKYALRLLWINAMAAVLPHPDNGELLVPAVIMALLGWVMDGPDVALPALRLMGLAAGLGLVIALISAALASRFAGQDKPNTDAKSGDGKASQSTAQQPEPTIDDSALMDGANIVEPSTKA